MPLLDRLYFSLNRLYFFRKNRRFKKNNPSVKMPPDYLIYESFRMDYENYYVDGKDTADWLVPEWSAFNNANNLRILDWGCGPGRVVRHLCGCLPRSEIYACDYNDQTIRWCEKNIPGITFIKNELEPPLPFQDNLFDIVYALSVFTHLSESNHGKWMEEIRRVLKPGGIFLFTTQGQIFIDKLSNSEKQKFLNGTLITRGNVKEGHRSFSSFHPQQFVRSLIETGWEVLKFRKGMMHAWGPEQDMWIIKKLN